MSRFLLIILGLLVMVGFAMAQSNPNWTLGFVPSPSQWNTQWSTKTDTSGGTLTGGTIAGATTMSGTIAGAPTFSGNVVFSGNPNFSGAPTGAASGMSVTPTNGTVSQTLAQLYSFRVVTAAGAITATTTDHIIEANKTVGAATTVNMPACNANSGLTLTVIDGKGDAGTNNITLAPSAGTISGSSTFVMNLNHQSETVSYDGSQCVVYPSFKSTSHQLIGIHVVGNTLYSNGIPIILHGVVRSGSEYMCEQGFGIFDNGTNSLNDDNQVPMMANWGINAVVLPMNEDCWLAINGINASYAGSNYINAITHEVATLESYGITPIISFVWGASGATLAAGQETMPDNSHAPTFWQSVGNTFKLDPKVMFRLQEEPHPAANTDTAAAWACWNGGDVQYSVTGGLTPSSSTSNCSEAFTTVGMQSLVNIVRGTGAENVIILSGIQFSNTFDQFLNVSYAITDPLPVPQLMAAADIFPETSICAITSCYTTQYLPVAAVMPFMAGEIGENAGGTCASGLGQVTTLMNFFDANRLGYLAWAWDLSGGNCLQLPGGVSATGLGAPESPWGTAYLAHLQSLVP